MNTSFFTDFPMVKDLECTQISMFNYIKTLADEEFLDNFFFEFWCYLEPFEKSDEEKGYYNVNLIRK